jgi:type I restriction enzyme S subunit
MKVGQRFTFAYDECYSEEAFEKYRKKLIPAGSTAVVTIGSIGQKLTLTHTPCFVNRAVNAVIPDPLRFDSVYVYYLLRHNLQLVKSADTGASSGRENVSKSNFSGIELSACLDLDEQKRIAKVLNSYDSLIEINQKRISLLEESARLLYREWFVNFRFPGHAAAKAEAGLPAGWEMGAIGDLALFLNRGMTPTYDDAASGLVINQKCIRGGRLNLKPARKQSKVVKPERQIQIGDVLINSTGAGTLGRVAQVRTPIPDCTVDTHVTIVRPSDGKSAAYLGVALLELEPVLSTMGIGSTNQLELGRADIAGLSIFMPPLAMREEFHELVWPLFMQAETLAKTNEHLTEARDALLPKLMSGEIQV